ncbi:MAG: NAD(+) diphosphatase [Clostridiales bacterium]|nr:NAD(+) diphosphatase [Clostridiales bacterium]
MLINKRHTEFSLLPNSDHIQADNTILLFRENEVLLRTVSKENRLPLWGDVAGGFAGTSPRHAFTQGTRRYFIASVQDDTPAPPSFAWENIRVFRILQPEMEGTLLNVAWHLSVWYANHRFCGACGSPTQPHPVERALTCEHCGLTVFPSILPAIIVAVTNGDRLLLAQNAHGAFRRFSLLAGFVEVGETAEQTVVREVLEEVGLRVKNIRYIKSQPWGLSQSLMLGFSAELDGSPEIRLQASELAEARWFSREDIPENDSTASISFNLMERFRRGL